MKQCKVNKWFLTKRGIGNDKVVHPFECIRMPLDFAMLSKRLPRATARAAPFKKDKLFCPCSPFGMRVPLSVRLFPFQWAAP